MTNLRRTFIILFTASVYSGVLFASEFGTPEEARAMLERAVVALQKDKSAALDAFNKGESEFRDRDLYVFCGGPDGVLTAHPRAKGKPLRRFKDITGKPLGEEMYTVASEGKFSEVTYLATRRGELLPREKISLITKVDDQICGVGYYNADKPTRSGNLALNSSEGVVIDGYDPVAYFALERAVKGSKQFSYEWLEAEWHFVNAKHRDMFIADPIKYTPQYGGYCAASMTKGKLVPVDPESWRIVDGKLYLNYSEQFLAKWSQDLNANIAKGNTHWEELKPKLSN